MILLSALLVTAAAAAAPDYGALLDELRDSQDVPGLAAAVVVGDTVVFADGSGTADLDTRRPVSADTRFYLGSLSKLFTAVFVLGLAGDELLDLHAPLDFRRDGAGITPAQLLSHGSGLPREGPSGYWFDADFPTEAELLDYARSADLGFTPGRGLRYSNVGYAVLGQLAAERTADEFPTAVERRVLAPLGMSNSGARGPAAGMARGYTPPGRLLPRDDRPFAGVGASVGDRRLREYHDARGMAPAFGAYSTAADMASFLRLLAGGGIGARLMQTQPSGWGLGLEPDTIAGRRVGRHGGWFAAHRSHLLIDPEAGIGIVVLANGDNANPARAAVVLYEALLRAAATSGSP